MLPGCRFADIGDALLVDGDNFDAAILSTPTFAHLEAIQLGTGKVPCPRCVEPPSSPSGLCGATASSARKHIMVEKPVCEGVDDIAKAFSAANKADVALFCSFQRRFDRSYRRVKEAVASGEIGVPQLVRRHRDAPNIHSVVALLITCGAVFAPD